MREHGSNLEYEAPQPAHPRPLNHNDDGSTPLQPPILHKSTATVEISDDAQTLGRHCRRQLTMDELME